MSVDTSTRKVDYSMTPIVAYTFAFRALTSAPTDIKAKVTVKATDVVSALTYTTNYTVVINSNGIGGTLSLVTTYGTTHKLTIYRETTDLQESDYNNYNQFPADTVETDLDRRTLKSQEVNETLGRCLQLDVASTVTSITLPPPSTGKALVWTGNTIRNSTYDIDTQQAAAASSATAALASQVAAAVSEANSLIYSNTSSTQAIASATSATASLSHVTTALTYSNIASSHSVTALTHSNTASSYSTNALTNATTAASEAVTALTHSNTAGSYSVTALTHSNTASSHSVTALTQSNTATTQATISASHAVTALTYSNIASSYSVTALTHATTAGSHATSALTSATTAASEATTAIAAAATIPSMPSVGTSGLVVKVKATEDGYELKTGAAGDVLYADTRYKVGSFTKDMSEASATTTAVTGLGFAPKYVDFLYGVDGQVGTIGWGKDDGAVRKNIALTTTSTLNLDAVNSILSVSAFATGYYTGYITSMDSDGFTITWTKNSSPTGTLSVYYTAYR